MPDLDDLDFELVTNANQLAPPPPLNRERVILPDWRTSTGKVAAVWVYELTALEFGQYQNSLRVYTDGRFVGINLEHDDLKLLAYTVRDGNGNRLWNTAQAVIDKLGQYGQASIDLLTAASNRVQKKQDPASAEGNSAETPTDS